MAITQTLTTSFKVDLLNGVHAFGTSVVRATTAPDVFKVALYSSTADLGAETTAYTATGEVTNTAGSAYVAGGVTLTTVAPVSSGTTAFLDFSDVTWSSASFTANGALIYNSSQSNKSAAVLAFGNNKTVTNGVFLIQFPSATASTALIRIA